jgi:hypothetical protein
MSYFKDLVDFSKMPLNKRYHFIIGLIILGFSYTVFYLEALRVERSAEFLDYIDKLSLRHTADKAAYEVKLEICNEKHIQYSKEVQKELRAYYFEYGELKKQVKK